MIASKSFVFRFADVEVREREFRVIKGGEVLPIEPKAFRVLLFLLHNPQRLIKKDELLDAVWNDANVSENSLARSVALLRKVLGDDIHEPRYIATVATLGYRFIAPVDVTEESGAELDVPAEPQPEATRDDSAEHTLNGTEAHATAVSPKNKIRPFRWKIAIPAILLALTAAAVWYLRRSSFPSPPVQRALTRLTFDDGLQTEPTWSPDGRYIAYTSDRGGKFDIWVQQIGGGNPIQITKGPGNHWQPNWSPDGKYIAYRSEEGDGGIYVIPALGGAGLERKIAPFGYYPKWSPNSSNILFQSHFTSLGSLNAFFIAQLDGGPPYEVLADFIAQNKTGVASAAWHPDGKRITFWVPDLSPSPTFWTVPIAGGPGIKLDIAPAVHKELAQASGELKAGQQWGDYPFSWSPSGDAIYFERGYRGAKNIWKLKVEPETMRATAIERLTTGPGPDEGIAVSTDGKQLAFTAMTKPIQAWLFPFDAGTARIKGNGIAITSPGRTAAEPVLSRDGTKVAYFAPHGESFLQTALNVYNEMWVKSLVDGSEVPAIADGNSRWYQAWSPDGRQLAYGRRNDTTKQWQVMTWSIQSRDEQPLADLGSIATCWDWSPDGKWLLLRASSGTISLLPVALAPHAETAVHEVTFDFKGQVYQLHFSPDGRWIVFNGFADTPNSESAIYVVPTSGGASTRITDGRHWDDKPRWSPDGRTIYFISKPGGFFNVWGVHFDPVAGKPVGQPFQVSRFDRPRLMIPRFIGQVGLSLTQDRLVLTMEQESGNIWILDNVDH